MKIDVTRKIYNHTGKPFKMSDESEGPGTEGKELTLRDVLVTALTTPTRDDEKLEAAKKIHRDQLAREIYTNDRADIPVGDIALLQELVNRIYAQPSIVAQTFELLDPKDGAQEIDPE